MSFTSDSFLTRFALNIAKPDLSSLKITRLPLPKYPCISEMQVFIGKFSLRQLCRHSNQLMQGNRSLLKTKEFFSALSNCHFSVCFQVQNFFISLHWSKKILSAHHSSSFVIPYSSPAFSFLSDRKWRRKEWTGRHSSGKKQTRAVNLDTRNLSDENNEIGLYFSPFCIIPTRLPLCLFVCQSVSPSLHTDTCQSY